MHKSCFRNLPLYTLPGFLAGKLFRSRPAAYGYFEGVWVPQLNNVVLGRWLVHHNLLHSRSQPVYSHSLPVPAFPSRPCSCFNCLYLLAYLLHPNHWRFSLRRMKKNIHILKTHTHTKHQRLYVRDQGSFKTRAAASSKCHIDKSSLLIILLLCSSFLFLGGGVCVR